MKRNTLYVLICLAALTLALGACSIPGLNITRGSGNVVTEERAVSNFSEVAVSGSGTLLIERGEREALTIEAEDNLLPLLTSDVVGKRLELGTRNGASIQTTRPIVYRLTVVNLEGLELSGSSEVTYNEVDAETFSVRISGSADVDVAGQADRQVLNISGSGHYRAAELVTREAEVNVSGSGDALVNVTDALDVAVSGSGDVTYIGDPRTSVDISGSGKIHQQ
jgi:hypothetical protein